MLEPPYFLCSPYSSLTVETPEPSATQTRHTNHAQVLGIKPLIFPMSPHSRAEATESSLNVAVPCPQRQTCDDHSGKD